MPGLEAESEKIMHFLAEEVSKDCFINIELKPRESREANASQIIDRLRDATKGVEGI